MRSKILLVAAMLVLGVSTIASTPALAKGPQPHSGGPPSCSVNPNPVAMGQTYTVSGNATAGAILNVAISDSVATSVVGTNADSNGNWGFSQVAFISGPAAVSVYEAQQLGHWKLVATCSFSVA